MASGTRSDLWLMAALTMAGPGPMDGILTPEQAESIEANGGRVARIPIKPMEPEGDDGVA